MHTINKRCCGLSLPLSLLMQVTINRGRPLSASFGKSSQHGGKEKSYTGTKSRKRRRERRLNWGPTSLSLPLSLSHHSSLCVTPFPSFSSALIKHDPHTSSSTALSEREREREREREKERERRKNKKKETQVVQDL